MSSVPDSSSQDGQDSTDNSAEKSIFNPSGDDDKKPGSSAQEKQGGVGDTALGLATSATPVGRLSAVLRGRKRSVWAGGGVIGGIIALLVMMFSLLSGPMQFVHFAQLMQKFHFRANEDFGDDRSSKVLLYALAGTGAERGRLGIVGNHAADKWEKTLLDKAGIRPVYNKTTRLNVGFEIVDEDKFYNSISDASKKDNKALERAMGKGVEIRSAGEVSSGKQDVVRGGSGEKVPGHVRIVDTRAVNLNERGKMIRTMGRLTNTSKISTAVGTRLLKKRAGVDFHPLKNVKRQAGEKVADYKEKRREEKAKRDSTGVTDQKLGHTDEKNKDGSSAETADNAAATDSANEAITEAESSIGRDALKNVLTKLGRGTAAVGVLCAAKSMGNDIPKYKYANIALPVMRMGMSTVTMGNEVMNNKGFNMDELSAYNDQFYDKKTKKSWIDAKSIQAELGEKQTGVDAPPEARLSGVNDKPVFFDALDSIPLLGQACGIMNAVGGLPIIKQVTSIGSEAVIGSIDVVAKQFGTSVDGIMEGALAAVSGKSANLLATGPEFGNLANTGVFLAANDSAVTMGGAPLSQTQTAELKYHEYLADKDINASKSLADRYLNPYDSSSLAGSIIDKTPASSEQVSSIFTGTASLISDSFRQLATALVPQTHAATSGYDYGIAKYGFSLAESEDPRFENPYNNAKIIEDSGQLDALNDKYGKTCFGMTITADDTGVHVSSESMGSDDVNIFKIAKEHPECDPKNNKDEMFLRYRFYLADSVTAESLNCYEGGIGADQSCADVGIDEGAPNTSSSSDTANNDSAPSGSAKDLAKQIEPYIDNSKIKCGLLGGGNANCSDITDTANGKSLKGVGGCTVDGLQPELLGMLLKLLQMGHTFGLTAVCTDHHAEVGRHSAGTAADFGVIDGVSMSGTGAWGGTKLEAAKKLDTDVASFMPKTTEFLQQQCHAKFDFLSGFAGSSIMTDPCHHQHITAGK
jgi:hypothetical protein